MLNLQASSVVELGLPEAKDDFEKGDIFIRKNKSVPEGSPQIYSNACAS